MGSIMTYGHALRVGLVAAGALLSSLSGLRTAKAAPEPVTVPVGQWVFYNTCWSDFDVGGGNLCATLHPSCSNGHGNKIVECQSYKTAYDDPNNSGPNLIVHQPYNDLPDDEKAMAVDDEGRAWVLTANNRIYHTYGQNWVYWHSVYSTVANGCADQIAVTGSISSNLIVMLRGCDKSVYKFVPSQNAWVYEVSSVVQLSTGAQPYAQDGSSAFWALDSNNDHAWVADTQTATFAQVNTIGGQATINLPGDCYNQPNGPTPLSCKQTNPYPYPVNAGGGELLFKGQYPAGDGNPDPTCFTTSLDSNSPDDIAYWYTAPWFASFTTNPYNFSTYDIVGYQQVDQWSSTDTSRLWLYPSKYIDQVDGQSSSVCRNLSPPQPMSVTADPTPVTKIREGSKYGRAGGAHHQGSTDARWIMTDSSRIYSFETTP